jgi:hypothetical protein
VNGSAFYNGCWASPAQSFLGPSPARLLTIFYCLRFETPPTWRARSPYLYPPGRGWSSYTPRHYSSNQVKVKDTLRLTVSQSVSLGVEPHLGLMIRYLLPYFTVSHLRLPFSSPPTTRRVTVEVFEPASTRALSHSQSQSQIQSYIATDGQSVCLSWCLALSGAHDQKLITV